jgi:hypothetical protein
VVNIAIRVGDVFSRGCAEDEIPGAWLTIILLGEYQILDPAILLDITKLITDFLATGVIKYQQVIGPAGILPDTVQANF